MIDRRILPLLLGCAALAGCWSRRTVYVIPQTEVTVTSAATGQPVEGAQVTLQRHHIGPPPRQLLESAQTRTTADGTAAFEELTEVETVYPLMMHGVPQRGWVLCVEHPSHRTHVTDGERPIERSGRVDSPWIVQVSLVPGEPSPP